MSLATVALNKANKAFRSSARKVAGSWNTLALTVASAPRNVICAQDRQAIYDATTNKTFIFYLGPNRDLYAITWDHATQRASTPVLVDVHRNPVTDEDDHTVPSVAFDDLGHLCVVWGTHGGAATFVRSTSPRSIAAWTSVTMPGVNGGTYQQIVFGGGKLWVFARANDPVGVAGHGTAYPAHEFGQLLYSSNRGTSWTEVPNGIIDLVTYSADATKDVYPFGIEYGPDGRVWLLWHVAHGDSHGGPREGVYVACYNPTTGHMETPGGTDLGARLDSPSDFTACRVAAGDYCNSGRLEVRPDGKALAVWTQNVIVDNHAQFITEPFDEPGFLPRDIRQFEQFGAGIVWRRLSTMSGRILIGAKGIYGHSSSGGSGYYPIQPALPSADYTVTMGWGAFGDKTGTLDVRARSSQANTNCYRAELTATTFKLFKTQGSSTQLGSTETIALADGDTGTIELTCAGTAITAVLKNAAGTTLKTIGPITDATFTTAGVPGFSAKGSTGEFQCLSVTSMKVPDVRSYIATKVGYWNGTTWTVTEAAARTNHSFSQPGLRYDTVNGRWEIYTITGRDTESLYAIIAAGAGDGHQQVPYAQLGADLSVMTSANGTTWSAPERIVRGEDVIGQGVAGVSVPRNSTNDAPVIVSTASSSSGSVGGAVSWRLPLYLATKTASADAAAQYSLRGPIEQRFQAVNVSFESGITPLSGGAYLAMSLYAYAPKGTTAVLVEIGVVGDGSAGQGTIKARGLGTTRTDISATFRRPDAWEQTVEGWIEVGSRRMIEVAVVGSAATSTTVRIKGVRSLSAAETVSRRTIEFREILDVEPS